MDKLRLEDLKANRREYAIFSEEELLEIVNDLRFSLSRIVCGTVNSKGVIQILNREEEIRFRDNVSRKPRILLVPKNSKVEEIWLLEATNR